MRTSATRIVALAIFMGICAVGTVAAAQNTGGKYSNPYIDDGTLNESPLKLDFNVTEIRGRTNNNNLRLIDHYLANDYDAVVRNLQNRYKTNKPLDASFKIIGYIFLSQQKHWAFTIKQKNTNIEHVMEVMPNTDGQGTIISLHTRKYGIKTAAYKRSWFGSSPAGGKKHSVKCKAY